MPPVEAKTSTMNVNKKLNASDNSQTRTLYSRICEIQPLELLQLLDKEGISARGDLSGLRARLLRHELRRNYPETNAALHKDLELNGTEADNWCAMMNLWEIDNRARMKMKEQQERSCLIVDRKFDDSVATKKPFENDEKERNRVDYLLSCVKLLKSWDLQYSGAKGPVAREFLESLKDFRKFAEIGDRVLLLMLPSVLPSEVKSWYRTTNFASWNEFEAAFVQRMVTWSPPRVPPTATTNLVPKMPQNLATNVATTDHRPVERRMSQSFALGSPDMKVYREAPKPQKIEQNQPRLQLSTSPLRIPHQNTEEERRRLREQEMHRARYMEYLQQSRLNCTKERFQPHTPQQVDTRVKCEKSQSTNHHECVQKLRVWNVKYSGEKGQAVTEFVDDLCDFRKYTGVSDDVLFDVLPCVLSGIAKSWYRNPSLMQKRWSTWDEFKEQFLKRFYGSEAAEERLKSVISGVENL